MGRFTDDWVVDRSMFEYVNSGGCACCGISHMGMDMMQFMAACSDIETDDGKKEVMSPWPEFMREEVWADRVKIRKNMKAEMAKYKTFMDAHGAGVAKWLLSLSSTLKSRIFQLPRAEVSSIVENNYDIRGAYMVVFCAVVEQVQNFPVTGYEADGRGGSEVAFESVLAFDRRSGFTIDTTDASAIETFCAFMERLGGPRLMPSREKSVNKNDGDDNDNNNEMNHGDQEEEEVVGQRGQSFRADRRIARIIIARYWADRVMEQYLRTVVDVDEDYGGDTVEEGVADDKAVSSFLKLDGLNGLKLEEKMSGGGGGGEAKE
jgi:hypothetical protein